MFKPRSFLGPGVLVAALALGGSGCVSGPGVGGDPDRLTQDQIASVDVSTLYDVVHRLRPRWLEVRSHRTFEGETQVMVVLNRTVIGGVDELREMGIDVASELEYMSGSRAQGEFALPGDRHVEGVIIVRTQDPGRL